MPALHGAMLMWFVLTGGSVAFVVWDSMTNAPTSWVQRIAWILVVLYTGPVNEGHPLPVVGVSTI